MSLVLTSTQVIEWTVRFIAVYLIIDSAEKLYCFREFKGKGFFSWEILRENMFFSSLPQFIRGLLNFIYDARVWLPLLAIRFLSGLLILFIPQQGLITVICLLNIFVIGSLMNFRNIPFGAETANRLVLTITGALLLRSVAPIELVTLACIWFIALQSCFSYLTAGISKLFNREWRNGNGLLHIINSSNLIPFGKTTVFFRKHDYLGKCLTWLTLGIECIFPVVLFVGQPFFWLFLLWGVSFHLIIAFRLRLGKFFWVWIATYPAIIFIAQR